MGSRTVRYIGLIYTTSALFCEELCTVLFKSGGIQFVLSQIHTNSLNIAYIERARAEYDKRNKYY